MSPYTNWNNTKLIVHDHHTDLHNLTQPKPLLDEAVTSEQQRRLPILNLGLHVAALVVALLHR